MMALFHDVLQSPGATDVDKANRKDLGTLTLSADARMITRVWAIVASVGTKTASKPVSGFITITSDDCDIEPLEFPFAPTPTHLNVTPNTYVDKPYKFPVNCPCPGKAKLQFYQTLGIAAPVSAPEVMVCVEFSDGEEAEEISGQVHMKSLEPSGALGTADNTLTTLSSIEIKGASRVIGGWGSAEVATPVADEAVVCVLSITCNEFANAGPWKFPLRTQESIDATTGQGGVGVTFCKTNRPLKPGISDAVLQGAITQYDANNAAPEAWYGVAYQ